MLAVVDQNSTRSKLNMAGNICFRVNLAYSNFQENLELK